MTLKSFYKLKICKFLLLLSSHIISIHFCLIKYVVQHLIVYVFASHINIHNLHSLLLPSVHLKHQFVHVLAIHINVDNFHFLLASQKPSKNSHCANSCLSYQCRLVLFPSVSSTVFKRLNLCTFLPLIYEHHFSSDSGSSFFLSVLKQLFSLLNYLLH